MIVRTALETAGNEVKHTGDGIMASFISCDAAIDAAVLIQRRLYEHMRDAEHRFEVRIGISAGEPVTEHNDLFGAAVQLAARRVLGRRRELDLRVGGGPRLVQRRHTGVHRARGPFELKGFADPIPLFEVAWNAD